MSDDPVLTAATALARELADPVRLTALQLLASEGPHTASRLAEALAVSAPRLGNHLARLREAGLVTVEHTGRHAVYRVADAGLGEVLNALFGYAGGTAPGTRRPRASAPADIAHTCYDHAAGLLGVRLLGTLVERGAVRAPDGRTDELALGPDPTALVDLGVDPSTVATGRRRPAVACLDRTYRLPHLGGELGRAILDALLRDGAVERTPGGRTLTVTPAGAARLAALLPGFTC
ncbi:ArsR/SmtB family transcription factor [Plantactinospora sp. CA-290183]|uniref:ArsR/SmtB family transcription factor n=1 Tax=Plantactinospora sp. CA-290183 TaxID=3240006 RepID=UPI003D925AA0